MVTPKIAPTDKSAIGNKGNNTLSSFVIEENGGGGSPILATGGDARTIQESQKRAYHLGEKKQRLVISTTSG